MVRPPVDIRRGTRPSQAPKPLPSENTIEQSLPGNLSAEDWAMMREIVEAVKRAIPDASSQSPGAVLQYVKDRLHD